MATTGGCAGACTAKVAKPEAPLGAVAMTWAMPALKPEANPLPFTLTTEGASEDQVNELPLMALPLLSLAVPPNCCVWLVLI